MIELLYSLDKDLAEMLSTFISDKSASIEMNKSELRIRLPRFLLLIAESWRFKEPELTEKELALEISDEAPESLNVPLFKKILLSETEALEILTIPEVSLPLMYILPAFELYFEILSFMVIKEVELR